MDGGVGGRIDPVRDVIVVVVVRSFDNSIIVLSINIIQFYTAGRQASPLNPHQVQQTDYGP